MEASLEEAFAHDPKLAKHLSVFEAEELTTWTDCMRLTNEDLKELGLRLGARNALTQMLCVRGLKPSEKGKLKIPNPLAKSVKTTNSTPAETATRQIHPAAGTGAATGAATPRMNNNMTEPWVMTEHIYTDLMDRRNRQRNYQAQTCIACRQSKVKCDKMSPCGRCVKRGTSCTPCGPSQRGKRSFKRRRKEAVMAAVMRGTPKDAPELIKGGLALGINAKHKQELLVHYQGHEGIRWMICDWIAIGARRRCCGLLAKALALAQKLAIPLDELLDIQNSGDGAMSFLSPLLRMPTVDSDLLGPPVDVREVSPQQWASVGLQYAAIENEWAMARETNKGRVRYFASRAFQQDFTTVERMGQAYIEKSKRRAPAAAVKAKAAGGAYPGAYSGNWFAKLFVPLGEHKKMLHMLGSQIRLCDTYASLPKASRLRTKVALRSGEHVEVIVMITLRITSRTSGMWVIRFARCAHKDRDIQTVAAHRFRMERACSCSSGGCGLCKIIHQEQGAYVPNHLPGGTSTLHSKSVRSDRLDIPLSDGCVPPTPSASLSSLSHAVAGFRRAGTSARAVGAPGFTGSFEPIPECEISIRNGANTDDGFNYFNIDDAILDLLTNI